MARRNHFATAVAMVVALLLFGAGCGGSDGPTDGGATAADSPLAVLLARMPTDAGGFMVAGVSIDRLGQLDTGRPDCGTGDRTDDWFGRAFGAAATVVPHAPALFRNGLDTAGSLEVEYGVTLCEVDWVVESLVTPGQTLMAGDFDAGRIDDAVRNDLLWSDAVAVDTSTESEFYDWGDELDFERRSPLRNLGIGGQLVVFDDLDPSVLAVTGNRDTMLDVIDAPGRSVGDDRHVAVALRTLVAAEPVSVMLTNDVPRWDPAVAAFDDIDSLRDDALRDGPDWLLERYELLALAQVVDDRGEGLEVAMVHQTAEAAEENLERLQRMLDVGEPLADDGQWRDFLVLESAGTRETLLVAQLRTVDADSSAFRIALSSLFQRDTLFATG